MVLAILLALSAQLVGWGGASDRGEAELLPYFGHPLNDLHEGSINLLGFIEHVECADFDADDYSYIAVPFNPVLFFTINRYGRGRADKVVQTPGAYIFDDGNQATFEPAITTFIAPVNEPDDSLPNNLTSRRLSAISNEWFDEKLRLRGKFYRDGLYIQIAAGLSLANSSCFFDCILSGISASPSLLGGFFGEKGRDTGGYQSEDAYKDANERGGSLLTRILSLIDSGFRTDDGAIGFASLLIWALSVAAVGLAGAIRWFDSRPGGYRLMIASLAIGIVPLVAIIQGNAS